MAHPAVLPRRSLLVALAASLALATILLGAPGRSVDAVGLATRYNVVFNGAATATGFNIAGGREAALALVAGAGGTVVYDMTAQIGVAVVDSTSPTFLQTVAASTAVEVAAEDFAWKALPTTQEALASGALRVLPAELAGPTIPAAAPPPPAGGPQETEDTLEPQQWSMRLVCAQADLERPDTCPAGAHSVQAGSPLVEVGILDSGIDGDHPDLAANMDCASGRDFVPVGPSPLSIGTPCDDNQFHGTHVAGIVAGDANAIGIVGVAPNVTLIPFKVCDTAGYCYASSSAAAITEAGVQHFEVINMSYFVDDDVFLESTEFKCNTDPVQRAFRRANERAIQFARNQGVVPVAALGNSDQDLAHPVDDSGQPISNECEVVPAETQGVVGTMALGRLSEKAEYSNYGVGMTDVAAPGGNFGALTDTPNDFCDEQVLSTIPGGWGCFQGTSMASPHVAGVAALIVSQFGRVANDAGEPDVVLRPQNVENYLQSTVVDIGEPGYDECFGNGRANALRAVLHDTSRVYDAAAPFCAEYAE